MAPHDGTPPWQRRLRALHLRSPRPTGTPRPMPAGSSQQQQPLPPPLRGAPRVFHDTAPGGTERAECLTFFRTYGFAVLGTALDKSEVEHLNNWYDASQRRYPEQWGTERGPSVEKMFHQPLLYYTELDQYVRHSGHYSLVAELLGGEEHARFSEFDVSAATASLGCDDSLTDGRPLLRTVSRNPSRHGRRLPSSRAPISSSAIAPVCLVGRRHNLRSGVTGRWPRPCLGRGGDPRAARPAAHGLHLQHALPYQRVRAVASLLRDSAGTDSPLTPTNVNCPQS